MDALVVADVLVACALIRLGYAPKALYRASRAIPPMEMDAAVIGDAGDGGRQPQLAPAEGSVGGRRRCARCMCGLQRRRRQHERAEPVRRRQGVGA